MYNNFFLAGFGGQGVLAVGNIIAEAAMRAGLHVTFMPSYGVEMRGGTANCTVVISDHEIGSPIITHPRNAVFFNLPSLAHYQPDVAANGMLIYNSSLIDTSEVKRNDLRVVPIPFNTLADSMGKTRLSNMIALGAILSLAEILGIEEVGAAMPFVFAEKYHKFLPTNMEAVKKGFEYASKLSPV